MEVFELKGHVVEIGPGVSGSEAEAIVVSPDGKEVFVHADRFEWCCNYTVSEKGYYGVVDGISGLDDSDYIEQYEELSETEGSAYYQIFVALDNVLQLIEG